MNNKLKHPVVFISYCWQSKEKKEFVQKIAKELRTVKGVDIKLDIWDLKSGHDVNFFMESSRNADKVIIMCDKAYKLKADSRQGGVGKETQYYVDEVLKDVKQEKYLPVIIEKDKNETLVKPIYLENRIHFDLTNHDTFEEEFDKLIYAIYDKDYYPRPPLGPIPIFNSPNNSTSESPVLHGSFESVSLTEKEKAISNTIGNLIKLNGIHSFEWFRTNRSIELSDDDFVKIISLSGQLEFSRTIKRSKSGERIIPGNPAVKLSNKYDDTLSSQEISILKQFVESKKPSLINTTTLRQISWHAGNIEIFVKDKRFFKSNLERLSNFGFLSEQISTKGNTYYLLTEQAVEYLEKMKENDLSEQAKFVLKKLQKSKGV